MRRCDMPSTELGGSTMDNEAYLITLRCTWEDQPSESFYASGNLFTTQKVEKEEYLVAQLVCDRLLEMGEETSVMILEQIPAVKSFFDRFSSVIFRKSLFDLMMTFEPWNEKCDWPPVLGPFNPLSLSLNISDISGGKILKRNVYLASRLQASSTIQSSEELVRVVTGSTIFDS
jgi:hypothetical protein